MRNSRIMSGNSSQAMLDEVEWKNEDRARNISLNSKPDWNSILIQLVAVLIIWFAFILFERIGGLTLAILLVLFFNIFKVKKA